MDYLKYIELKKKTQSEVATGEFLIWEAYTYFLYQNQQNNKKQVKQ